MVEAPEIIWLQNAEDAKHQCEGRLWCEDKVWPQNEEEGEPTKYLRADIAERQIAELRAERDEARRHCSGKDKVAKAYYDNWRDAEAENARLRALPLKDEVERVAEGLRIYAASLRGQHSTRNEVADELDRLASALLSRLQTGKQEGRDGLSAWAGWDKARDQWGETKHKDAVLEALFRGPWSVEDAAALIGFINRTWTRRPAAHDQGGDRG